MRKIPQIGLVVALHLNSEAMQHSTGLSQLTDHKLSTIVAPTTPTRKFEIGSPSKTFIEKLLDAALASCRKQSGFSKSLSERTGKGLFVVCAATGLCLVVVQMAVWM